MAASALQIRHLEELSLNAWPSLQTLHYDGWILRFADGYTRRANSVSPLYASTLPLEDKIAHCRAVYAANNRRVVFKLTAAAQPESLDAELAARGYWKDAETSVQTLSLGGLRVTSYGDIESTCSDAWLAHFFRLNADDFNRLPTLERMLTNLRLPTAYASVRRNGAVVALGIGVLEQGYIGISGIVVDAAWRRRGVGTELLNTLLAWGKANEAHTAHLQVMCDNAPAWSMYEKFGFIEQYRYWYRMQP